MCVHYCTYTHSPFYNLGCKYLQSVHSGKTTTMDTATVNQQESPYSYTMYITHIWTCAHNTYTDRQTYNTVTLTLRALKEYLGEFFKPKQLYKWFWRVGS